MAGTALKPRLKLEVCAFFVDEFQAALAAEKRDDIEIVPIHGACDERHYPASTETPSAQSEVPILHMMGVCSGRADCPRTLHSCFELLIGSDKVDALQGEGAHLLTPAMVRAYPETLQSLNVKSENLHAYFAESVHAWVVVDVGVAPLTAAEQAAFLTGTGGKMELLPAELHLFRANLRAALAQWEAATVGTRSAKQAEQTALLQHRLADYTMAYDLISRLIPYQREQTIIDAILELFYMLCAPRAVHILLAQDGGNNSDANTVDESAQLFSLPADSGKKDHLRTLLNCSAPSGEIEVPNGFYFQIHQENTQTLGVVVIEGKFLPEHQRSYLDVAHLLMPILRLALNNARSYEKLSNTERKLRASQMELEQRVEERTRELRESESRFRNILENAPVGMVITALDGRFIQANHALCTMLGYKKRELEELTFRDITHPEDMAHTLSNVQQLLDGKINSYRMEKRYLRKDGQVVWTQLVASIERDDSGAPLYFIGQIEDITERKQAEEKLLASKQKFKQLFMLVPIPLGVVNKDGVIVYFNDWFTKVFGYTTDDVPTIKEWWQLAYPDESYRQWVMDSWDMAVAKAAKEGTDIEPAEYRVTCKCGSERIVLIGGATIEDNLLATFIDITERKKAETELHIAATAFESQEGMVVTDAHSVILRVNHAFTEITGYTAEEVVGQTPRLLKSGRHDAAFYAAMWKNIRRNGSWQGEIWNRRKNGEVYPEQLTITAVKRDDGETTHFVATLHDITERKASEEKIRNLAFYDTLTQLPNRRLLNDRLSQTMAASKRSGHYGALMFLDLDNFKPLNDTYGHGVGDLLLIEVARRISLCVRETDTVARFGGDEFVVMLSELDEDKAESTSQAGIIAEKIRVNLAEPYLLTIQQGGKAENIVEHHCTSSIGAVLFINHEASREDILKWADMAMYQAKDSGRNLIRFYES